MGIEQVLTLALEKGLFAALFVISFWFILTENKKREESQRELYVDLAESLDNAKDAITSIENEIERIGQAQTNISQDLLEVKYMINNMETLVKAQLSNKERA